MKKVLVIGKSGQLAMALQELSDAAEWKFLDRRLLDLSKTETILGKLKAEEFDVLINCAAYTAVDQAEDEPEIAHKINAEALLPIAEACRQKDAWLVHISTDYVFGSGHARPFRERDATAPTGVYGISKLKGEENIATVTERHIIIRTSWLYGSTGHNFLRTMLKLSESRDRLNVVFDQIGTPTYVNDLAEALVKIVCGEIETAQAGIYHYSNEGAASWYDFAQAIFEIDGREIDVDPVRTDAFPTKAERPPYSMLDKQKIKDTFGLHIPYWRDAVRRCLEKLNND